MANITISARGNEFSRQGLLNMLQGVFSDEDTNGNNGDGYYKLSKQMCDDDFMSEKYSDEAIPEDIVIKEYADWYMHTMVDYCERWQDYTVAYDDKGRAIAISYAYY